MAEMTSTPARQTIAGGARGAALRGTSPRYWTCLGVLVVAAVSVRVLPLLGVFPQKEAVPLKRDLQLFDARKVGPRYVRHPRNDSLEPLKQDVIDTLGTSDYLRIFLTDTRKSPADPTSVAHVFVTYYTGQPDLVPHVPDICYHAGGYDPLGADNVDVPVRGVGASDDRVPVRVVRFRAPPSSHAPDGDEVAVLYFFEANGGYACTRDGVRWKLANPRARFAYYAKIEVTFTDSELRRTAGQAGSLEALTPLLEAVLPVLHDEHFNWDGAKEAPAVPAGPGPITAASWDRAPARG